MGFFSKIKEGLKKTADNISKKIFNAFNAKNLDEFYEELEMSLLSSDLGATATDNIIEKLKDGVFREKLKNPEDAKDLLKRIMLEEIDYEIPEYEYPLVILVAGVNGVGKTTAIGKLSEFFRKKWKSVVIAAADTFRAAAGEQLEVWAKRGGARLIKHEEGADAAAVVFDALSSQKAKNYDVLLIDTAGRLQTKKNLMEELKKIYKVVQRERPDADYRCYIVLDATTGQNAVSQVDIFGEAVDIDGIILNKLDGTAKGGVVFAISAEKEIPVVFIGVGEKLDDLLEFDPKTFVDEIVG